MKKLTKGACLLATIALSGVLASQAFAVSCDIGANATQRIAFCQGTLGDLGISPSSCKYNGGSIDFGGSKTCPVNGTCSVRYFKPTSLTGPAVMNYGTRFCDV